MSLPEFVIMEGVKRAWEFFQNNAHVVGYLLQEMEPAKQERYRKLIEEENVSVHFSYSSNQPRFPSFAIVLQGENEEHVFLDDGGPDDVEMPYPSPGEEDWMEHEDYYGVMIESGAPQLTSIDGDQAKVSVRPVVRTQMPGKNLDYQRTDLGIESPENYERMGTPSKLFDRNRQRIASRSWIDRVSVGVLVTTDNQEKTLVYYRLLRWALRQLTMWFHVNGVKSMSFSGADLSPNEQLTPSPGPLVFQRQLSMSFQHEEKAFEAEAILRGWLLDISLATPASDGTLEFTQVLVATGTAEDDG